MNNPTTHSTDSETVAELVVAAMAWQAMQDSEAGARLDASRAAVENRLAEATAAERNLYRALSKITAFVAEWRDCLEGVQMSEATFEADSGLTEARAALAKAREAQS